MKKVIIKNWPYPKGVKAMLLRIGDPVYDGQGNWHSDVSFRSIYKEYKTVPLSWGLLPMLKTGQVFCDGHQVDYNRSAKRKKFDFSDAKFKFFTHQFTSNNVLVKLPCFRTIQNDIIYNITAIEVVRCFFARTRTLAYEILQENSLIRLCQSKLNEVNKKSVTIQLAPECPARLCSETWLPFLAWLSTNELAQLSWTSFFNYYRIWQNVKSEVEFNPLFPLLGDFSLDCYWRSYGKNIWFDEISNIHCDALHFDEILASKYVTENKKDPNNRNGRSKFTSTLSDNVEIVNTEPASSGSSMTLKTDLPDFIFEKQPKVYIIGKIMEVGKNHVNGIFEVNDEIEVTGKNIGFNNCRKGIEFTANVGNNLAKMDLDISFALDLLEASEKDLACNTTLNSYLDEINNISKMPGIVGMKTKIFQIPGDSSFVWIFPGIKRCCAVSIIQLDKGKQIYLVEADRTIYNTKGKWQVATLILITDNKRLNILKQLITLLAHTGHWDVGELDLLRPKITYRRLKHSNKNHRALKIYNIILDL
jgi:hypothetical protein